MTAHDPDMVYRSTARPNPTPRQGALSESGPRDCVRRVRGLPAGKVQVQDPSAHLSQVAAVAGRHDGLAAKAVAPNRVVQRVSTLRRLAASVDADQFIAQVRWTHVQQERPSSLLDLELSVRLACPDLRATM
jgi:hypothetical protein